MQIDPQDDLQALLLLLPGRITAKLNEINRYNELIDIVLDRGRKPTARFLSGEMVLSDIEVTSEDLAQVVSRIGQFDDDNRAGLERTLHRIAAIRNRRGDVVGLTCRVGRAVYGTIDIVKDLINSGKSILLLGRPGVGKTTMLREAARIMAETKRVVIVDTSNEIGGDGDVPHPAIGLARRMQVPVPARQHEIMIEAVENHTPEVIVIDEIGREQEAQAARTIAERGVQLVGTAHGHTLENLMLNPTLTDLVGGIESVTLSDEEARRRGTQKTVLERRAPPTFDILIEIETRTRLHVHHDVAEAVDNILRGNQVTPELRFWDERGEIRREPARVRVNQPNGQRMSKRGAGNLQSNTMPFSGSGREILPAAPVPAAPIEPARPPLGDYGNGSSTNGNGNGHANDAPLEPVRVYAYGITRNRLDQAARRLRVPMTLVDAVEDADALVTLKSHYRRHERPITDAEGMAMPIYVLRANSINQMENFLIDLFDLQRIGVSPEDPVMVAALDEARRAIDDIMGGKRVIDLSPQSSTIRRYQHQLAREANLVSHSYGEEPNRRVRIYRE